MSKFIHLHTHSHYSLLTALPKIDDLVKKAKKYEMPALALTDNCNLYGAIEFFSECKKKEIKPIIGIDAYLAPRTRFDKEAGVDKSRTRLVLLAKNEVGYKNLIQLVSKAHLEGFYYKARIDKELLELHSEGLVCISPSFSGDIVQAVRLANFPLASEKTAFYKKLFGDDFYIEITHHQEIKGHSESMEKLVAYAKENNVQLVAAHDVYYLDPEDKKARETLLSIQNGGDFVERNTEEDFSFISSEKAEKYFKDLPEALENTVKIADKCNLEIELGKWVFPNYIVESGLSYDDELRRITYEGIERRKVTDTPELRTRVDYELTVIKNKGYSPYFLVVGDLLKFARENGILSNIRGSVSGSMVTYLAGITNIDPIEFEIPFERFLNPDRPSAPDIDMDFADNRRDEMVDYARRKYGTDKVAQIGTFGTMAARGSIRDVTRALGFPYSTGDMISKLIPMGAQGFPMTIDRAIDEVPELKEIYTNDQTVKQIVDMAKKIEGCARHMGIHAAGVVMSPSAITDYTALQYDPKGEGKIITQYDMYSIEDAGLLKFDFLGLKNLSIIADTLALMKKTVGVALMQDDIPMEDKKTFRMLARGDTTDLFQLNGAGMTRFLVDLKPTTIHDINAMVALYRPGPIQFIPEYIDRKHGKVIISYLDPALEPILSKTYGILVYQDDLLMMAHKLAGYSWGDVDKFRKAVGKKIPEEMQKQKENFIQGCVTHSGWPEKKARELWTWIEPFASYGFNKAHSVSYGKVAFQTAYLKANYPAEYMASVLTHHGGEVEKVAESIAECKRLGITILPPDVNESFEGFTVIKEKGYAEDAQTLEEKIELRIATKEFSADSIRFGLTTIKNFGAGIAESIIKERKARGHFTSLEDFLSRINDKNLNKKSLEALIKTGAFDLLISTHYSRHTLLKNLDTLLTYHKESRIESSTAQDSLFGNSEGNTLSKLNLVPEENSNTADQLLWEKELLGLYISGHPLQQFAERLDKRDMPICKVKEKTKAKEVVMIGGIIEEIKEIMTKKGDKMLFVRLADISDSIELVVFPKVYVEFRDVIAIDNCVVVKGVYSKKDGKESVLVDKIKLLE
ncbi:MAG: DNA polymerase III subunit alpha [Candidatus Zambryskibacteria bacterium]|nr:DNA polymerase III subunit alpha [Candidatus Zambryskibacteria bacterium]